MNNYFYECKKNVLLIKACSKNQEQRNTERWNTECQNTKSRTVKLGTLNMEHQFWNGKNQNTKPEAVKPGTLIYGTVLLDEIVNSMVLNVDVVVFQSWNIDTVALNPLKNQLELRFYGLIGTVSQCCRLLKGKHFLRFTFYFFYLTF